jgi:hypothetical protein
VSDEHWKGAIERIELDAGLRIYLVAADIIQDMVLDPRNTTLSPTFSGQLSAAGDFAIEVPDGVRSRLTPGNGIFFQPPANVATYRLAGGQRLRAAGYAFDVNRVARIFDGDVPASLRPLFRSVGSRRG